ncbi:hypothetical protein CHELA1G11_20797 [Hyphomicrobiales bacterium]|nr:hypothetical protein CHELA1G11_20797 [Hyphomicrobiales bacterium]CAH1691984.1 hypothetical protein CHELA1G2_21112 [Hyphomicrobiales bacterium]
MGDQPIDRRQTTEAEVRRRPSEGLEGNEIAASLRRGGGIVTSRRYTGYHLMIGSWVSPKISSLMPFQLHKCPLRYGVGSLPDVNVDG